MAAGSLSMFIPSLGAINSSSPRSPSAGKHFLLATCSSQTEEPSRNQSSSGSPGTKNCRTTVSTALAAAVIALGCSLPANAGLIKPEASICSAAQLAVGKGKLCFTEGHLMELYDMGMLYKKDHWANLAASSGSLEVTASSNTEHALFDASILQRSNDAVEHPRFAVDLISGLVITDIDPATAKLAAGILGPSLSAFGFLFIVRIVMSWYPKLPVGEFPYVLAYTPTEPFLTVTRKVIPPLGGVDVTPVVWFGIISFLHEILVGPQGLLVLLSQQVG